MGRFFLFLIFSILIGCQSSNDAAPQPWLPPEPKNQATGTSDGGGGVIASSEPEQIIKVVKETQQLISDNFGNEEKFGRVFLYHSQDRNLFSEKGLSVLQVIRRPSYFRKNFDGPGELPNFLDDYLLSIPIVFEAESPCPAPDKDHADASVTEFSYDATLCFSLKTLHRLPPEALPARLAGLWFHELAHMNGFDEQRAIALEEDIVRAWPYILKLDVASPVLFTDSYLSMVSLAIEKIIRLATSMTENPSSSEQLRLSLELGRALGEAKAYLDSFRQHVDYSGGEKICKPGFPESSSKGQLSQRTEAQLSKIQSLIDAIMPSDSVAVKLPNDDWLKATEQLNQDFTVSILTYCEGLDIPAT